MRSKIKNKTEHPDHRQRNRCKRKGQYTALFSILLLPMLLFLGMGLDFGMYYINEARLIRAVDGAALRLASNYSTDIGDQQDVVADMIQANYPNWGNPGGWTQLTSDPDGYQFRSVSSKGNTIYFAATQANSSTSAGDSSSLFPLPNTLGYDGEDNMGGSKGGYTYTATNGLRDAIYDGYEWDTNLDTTAYQQSQAISVRMKAEVSHNTYFLPLARIDTIDMSQETEVSRRPSVTILILDNSQSMNNNDTGDGRRYEALQQAVKNFVSEFDDSQDLFGVVYFAGKGKIMFPKNGPFVPRTGFQATITDMMDTDDEIEQDFILGPHTHAQEAMRLAYNMVENYFSAVPEARDNVKVSYVFFTDGQFTSARTMVRGPGYNTIHDQDSVPWTHYVKPVSYSSNLAGVTFNQRSANGGDSGNYDLATLIQGVDMTTMEGINTNISKWYTNTKNVAWRSVASSEKYSTDTDVNSIQAAVRGGNDLDSRNDDFWAPWTWVNATFGGANNLVNQTPIPIVMSNYNDAVVDAGKDAYVSNDGSSYVYFANEIDPATGMEVSPAVSKPQFLVGQQLMDDIIFNEVNRVTGDAVLTFPGRIRTPRQNWTTDQNTDVTTMILYAGWPDEWKALQTNPNRYPYYYYRTPDVDESIRWTSTLIDPNRNMDVEELEMEPGCISFQNHHLRYNNKPVQGNARFGAWDDGDNVFEDISIDSWMSAQHDGNNTKNRQRTHRSFRMQEIYPEFNLGGDHESSTSGHPTQFWSWKSGGWMNVTQSKILTEANWLTEVQCWLAREDHDATVYTVIFGRSLQNEHYSMSNVKSSDSGQKLYDGQKLGVCYRADTATELQEVFADIASRIAVSITQ
ncbi:MAG: VWA domain-containing protein [Verrucomicrobiota bacterium]